MRFTCVKKRATLLYRIREEPLASNNRLPIVCMTPDSISNPIYRVVTVEDSVRAHRFPLKVWLGKGGPQYDEFEHYYQKT